MRSPRKPEFKNAIRFCISIIAILILVLIGCDMRSGDTGLSRIIIPVTDSVKSIKSISAAIKQAPGNISSVTLTITGSDMGTITGTYPPDITSIVVEVPAGSDRNIELVVNIGPSDPGHVLSWAGDSTTDLEAGSTKTLTLDMRANETKLIVPDATGNRLLQFDDISGSGQKTRTGPDIGFAGTFLPYDVDFDSLGRIYIACNWVVTGGSRVIRIDNMDATSNTFIVEDPSTMAGVNALAIDRVNDLIYFSAGNPIPNELYKWDVAGSVRTLLTITGIGKIQGLDVDENGILYIAGEDGSTNDRVFRYDPVAQNVTGQYIATSLDPWDVIVKTPYLYVANITVVSGTSILQLDMNLQFVQGYGDNITGTNTSPGQFYGAHRFIAILNKKLTIVDDDSGSTNDKLVSIDDINGTGWTTLPTSGDGQTFFTFYGC